jgi:hypothetical protein
MMDSTIPQRNARPIRYEAATHLFTTGQIVQQLQLTIQPDRGS